MKSIKRPLSTFKTHLRIIGINVNSETVSKFEKLSDNFKVCYSLLCYCYIIAGFTHTISKRDEDFYKSFMYLIPSVVFFIKYLQMIGSKKLIIDFINEIDSTYMNEEEETRKYIDKADMKITIVINSLIIGYFVSIGAILVPSYIRRHLGYNLSKAPLAIFTPFDPATEYLKVVLFQFCVLLAIGHVALMTYTTIFTFTMQMRAQVQVIGSVFKSVHYDDEEAIITSKYEEQNIKNIAKIKKCIMYHARVLRLHSITNEMLSGVFSLEILVSSIQSCLTLYQATRNDSYINEFYIHSFVMYLWSYIICWCGSQIESMTSESLNFCYGTVWYRLKPKDRKMIVTFMTVANMPMHFSYRGIFNINLDQYITILKGSYSYYTVINGLEGS